MNRPDPAAPAAAPVRQPLAPRARRRPRALLATLAALAVGLAVAGPAHADTVKIRHNGFEPQTVTLDAGDTIDFVSESLLTQTVTSDRGLFDSGDLGLGSAFTMALSVPGVHHYGSTTNPGLRGTIVVRAGAFGGAPDDAVLDRIPDVPFPPAEANDVRTHPSFGIPASRTRILVGFREGATVQQANDVRLEAQATIIGGLPRLGVVLFDVGEAYFPDRPGQDWHIFTNVERALEILRASPAVEFAAMSTEVGRAGLPRRAEQAIEGGSPPWRWDDPRGIGNWGLHAARFPHAWNFLESLRRADNDVVTGVVDVGFEEHEDLPALEILDELCSPECTSIGSWYELDGSESHGTHVAGTIGAAFDNPFPAGDDSASRSLGVSGGNPVARLLGIPMSSGGERELQTEAAWLFDGQLQLFDRIIAAKPEGVRVLNYSAGASVFKENGRLATDLSGQPLWWKAFPEKTCGPGPVDDELPELDAGTKQWCTPSNADLWLREFGQIGLAAARVARAAADADILIVQSAGNDGALFCAPHGDASCTTQPIDTASTNEFAWASRRWSKVGHGRGNPILIVEAHDGSGKAAPFSNLGGDLSAPGVDILATTVGNGYESKSGTSMAAPHVTAAAGMILAAEPELAVDQLRARLIAFARPGPTRSAGPLFEWRAQARLNRDDLAHGLVTYPRTVEDVDAAFRIDFDACGATAGGEPATRFTWVVGGQQVAETAECRFTHPFAAEGAYAVTLTVAAAGGATASHTENVRVDDLLIVSLGDSIGSGEGNPDLGRSEWSSSVAQWNDRRCHRSARGGPAQAARLLELADPQRSVTFVHLACSGGRMEGDRGADGALIPGFEGVGGLLTPYEGIVPPDKTCELGPRTDLEACLPPQLDRARELLGGREPDALFVSIGANDMWFSKILLDCLHPFNQCNTGVGRELFETRIRLLEPRYERLAQRISALFPQLPPARVFITEYPDLTQNDAGDIDLSCVAFPLEIDANEASWAADEVIPRLNEAVRRNANRHGWTPVTGISADFARHGYCATDTWMRPLTGSLATQGDKEGAFHPNFPGHSAYARRIVGRVRAELGLGAQPGSGPAVRDTTPRLDAFAAMLAGSGAAKKLVDVNDVSRDGNRRVIRELAADGTISERPDETFSNVAGERTASDGYVDMRDFRRFRDAWLQACTEARWDLDFRRDTTCPASEEIVLDGDDDHAKRDQNLDGCVWRATDPDECLTPESTFSRFDFNGDANVSTAKALVPLRADGTPAPDRAGGTELSDLDVLRSQWAVDPKTQEGWEGDDLDALLRSADLEIHADALFEAGARTAQITVRRKGGDEIAPERTIKRDDHLLVTVPLSAPREELEVLARGRTDDGDTTAISDVLTPAYGEDVRVDVCAGLSLQAEPGSIPADGESTAIVTATLRECAGVEDVADKPIQFTLAPSEGGGTLQALTPATNADGKAKARFTAGTEKATYTVKAVVEIAPGVKQEAELELETGAKVTIRYVWRQTIEDWWQEGSTRWATASALQPDCQIPGVVRYCVDAWRVALEDQTGSGLERAGTITGGGQNFRVSEQVANSTTRSRSSWAYTLHEDGRQYEGAELATWSVTNPSAYQDHGVQGLVAQDGEDGLLVEGLQTVGDLPYTYSLFADRAGSTKPIVLGSVISSLLLVPQPEGAHTWFGAHADREVLFRRGDGGELLPYTSCSLLDEDLQTEPGYWLENPNPHIPSAISFTRKADYAAGDLPMPVGPGRMKVRYAFAATVAYGDEEPAPPVLPDCAASSDPVADFSATPAEAEEGRIVQFRDRSTDPENDLVKWEWDFGDGATGSGPRQWHMFPDDGTYTVSLTVTDADGRTDTTTREVTITNVDPEGFLDDAAAQVGQPLAIRLGILDQGHADKSALEWRISSTNPALTLELSGTDKANVYNYEIIGLPAGVYPVTLTVRDKDGGVGTADATWTITAEPPPPPPPPPSTSFPSCDPAVTLDPEEQGFLRLLNDYRADNGLPPVKVSATLTTASDGHSTDMAQRGSMSHTGSDGSTPAQRAWRAGYPSDAGVGENVASGTVTDSEALWAWRSSLTGHNENMLRSYWKAIGIARVHGSGRWWWTTKFGTKVDCPVTAAATADTEAQASRAPDDEDAADDAALEPDPAGGAEPGDLGEAGAALPSGEGKGDDSEPGSISKAPGERAGREAEGGEDAATEAAQGVLPQSAPSDPSSEAGLSDSGAAAVAAAYPPTPALTVSAIEPVVGQPVTLTNRSRDAAGNPIPAVLRPGVGDDVPLGPDDAHVRSYSQPASLQPTINVDVPGDFPLYVYRNVMVVPKLAPRLDYIGATVVGVGNPLAARVQAYDPYMAGPAAGIALVLELGGETATVTTNAAGVAEASLPTTGIPAGQATVAASFAGDVRLAAASKTTTVQIIQNTPPLATPGGPYVVGEGARVLLDASRSSDPDQGDAVIDWTWDLDGDGAFGDRVGPTPAELEWDEIEAEVCGGACEPGTEYPIAVRVRDTRGDTSIGTTTLTVTPDFGILLGGEHRTIVPGQSNSFAVSVVGSSTWTAPVTLSALNLPPGVTATFSKNPVTPTGASVLRLTAAAGAGTGTFKIVVQGVGGGLTRTTDEEQLEVEFGLLPVCTGAFTGTITNRDTGEPIDGARIAVSGEPQVSSDEHGRWTMNEVDLGVSNAARVHTVTVTKPEAWGSSKVAEAMCGATTRVDLTVRTKQLGEVSGRVLDKETRRPIKGAQVNGVSTAGLPVFTTDANGAFGGYVPLGNENVPATHTYRASASNYWYADRQLRGELGVPAPPVDYELVKKCSGEIGTVTVLWADTLAPAAGAPVRLDVGNGVVGATNAEGKYAFNWPVELGHNNSAKSYTVTATAPRDAPPGTLPAIGQSVTVGACGSRVDLTILFPRPVASKGSAEGFVTDEETNEPVAGADVTIASGSSGKTDANGFYRIEDVLLGYAGEAQVTKSIGAGKAEYWGVQQNVVLKRNESVRQDLKLVRMRKGALQGEVVDAVTGLPLPNAQVSDANCTSSSTVCVSAGVDGRFGRSGLELAYRNQPRALSLTAQLPGYWPATKPATLRADETTSVDLALLKECTGATIRGRVVNAETQQPIALAQVSVDGRLVTVRTDADGRFLIPNLKVGGGNTPTSVSITASAAGFHSQTKQVTIFCGASITIDFGRRGAGTGTIVGTVTNADTNEPIAGLFVGSEFGGTATTNGFGVYRLENVPLGDLDADHEWKVYAQPSGFRLQTKTALVKAGVESTVDFEFSTDGNTLPVADAATHQLDEDTYAVFQTTGSDADGDPLSYHVVRGPQHGRLTGSAPVLTYHPDRDFRGSDTMEFVVHDGQDASQRATVTFVVAPVNDAPTPGHDELDRAAGVPARIAVAELLANDTDPDGDAPAITSVLAFGSATASLQGDEVVVTAPPAGIQANFSYVVSDPHGATATGNVVVRFVTTPLPPSCPPRTFEGVQGQPLQGALACTDPNGDALTYELVAAPAAGSVQLGAGGAFTYTPPVGFAGTTTFTYRAGDGTLQSAPATATLVIAPTNRPPAADAGGLETEEDTPLVLTLTGSDPDGDDLQFEVVAQPLHGTLSGSAPALTYTPDADYHGPDELSFRVSDGQAQSAAATVTIEVTPVNDAPAAQPLQLATPEDVPLALALLADDVDGDELTFAAVVAPAHGTLAGTGAARTYTPEQDWHGTDSFTFLVSDGELWSQATVSIQVTPVNDAPVAADDVGETEQGAALELPVADLLANDGDVDGDALAATAVQGTAATNGTVTLAGGIVRYAPEPAFSGEASFRYTVSDGAGGTATALVRVTVHAREEISRAVVVLLDQDAIEAGAAPNRFSTRDVNADLASIGLRQQLRWFAANPGRTIDLFSGQVGDEGWFAPQTIPAAWNRSGPTTDGLRNLLAAGPGLGTRGRNLDGRTLEREALLDKVPNVTPLRATGLAGLVGRDVCAVAWKGDIGIGYGPLTGSLKGANLGRAAFRVDAVRKLTGYSSSALPRVTLTVLDAHEVCGRELDLHVDAPRPTSSSTPFDVDPAGAFRPNWLRG